MNFQPSHLCGLSTETQVCQNFISELKKFPDDCYRMEKTLSEEEKQRINALLEKYHPREEIQEKEMVVLSEKRKRDQH